MEKGEKMNIFFKGSRLSGGAPRSALQYLKVLKVDGHKITALIQEGDAGLKAEYIQLIDKLICRDDLSKFLWVHNYFKAYIVVKQNLKFIKENQFDFLLADGFLNDFFFGDFCQKNKISVVTLIAGGDLSACEYALPHCRSDHFICFSKENKDVLSKYFDADKITVISNRIQLTKRFDDVQKHYRFDSSDTVNVLMTSRLHGDKYDSVVNFIDTLNSVASQNRRISLVIAGDGDRIDELKKYAGSVDNSCLSVEFAGHIDDLVPYFEKAHIVVGKARSVLEPIMMNRIGCVIGDDGRLEVCTTKNFENLYHFNFSGRNLQKENPTAEMIALIDSLVDGSFDFNDFEQTVEMISQHYSSEYLADKFHAVLDSLEPPQKTKRVVSPLLLVIKYMFLKVCRKLKRKVSHG